MANFQIWIKFTESIEEAQNIRGVNFEIALWNV